MIGSGAGQDWLRLVLEADGLSDYRDTAQHRHHVDWVGRALSAISMGTVGFIVVAAGIGIAQSRPQVTAEQDELRARFQEACKLRPDLEACEAGGIQGDGRKLVDSRIYD